LNLRRFGLLADENLHPGVVTFLRQQGLDVRDVRESGWAGASDLALMQKAVAENRVVLTHDSDFGTLAVLAGEPVIGIVYLRPGHIECSFTVETIQGLMRDTREPNPPFLVVADRAGTTLRFRIREL